MLTQITRRNDIGSHLFGTYCVPGTFCQAQTCRFHVTPTSAQARETGTLFLFIQGRKIVQGHKESEWQSHEADPGLTDSECVFSVTPYAHHCPTTARPQQTTAPTGPSFSTESNFSPTPTSHSS